MLLFRPCHPLTALDSCCTVHVQYMTYCNTYVTHIVQACARAGQFSGAAEHTCSCVLVPAGLLFRTGSSASMYNGACKAAKVHPCSTSHGRGGAPASSSLPQQPAAAGHRSSGSSPAHGAPLQTRFIARLQWLAGSSYL